MASSINFNNYVKRFSEAMRGVQRILFVGTGYDISQYPALAGQAWKCIYTTSQAANFAEAFDRKDRQVRPVSTIAAYNAANTKLDQKNPLLIYLNGIGTLDEDVDALELEAEQEENTKALQATLGMLLRSDLLVELVVVGYDPKNEKELRPKDFYTLARKLTDKRITFYGMSEEQENDRYISALVRDGIAEVFAQDLGGALKEEVRQCFGDDDDDYSVDDDDYTDDELKNTVYINGNPVVLTQSLCYDFNKYGKVLSVDEMATGTISRMMQVDYFYQFLKRSPNTPQWYGYAPRNGFAVRREYEQELYNAVVKGLKENNEKPVVLAGQTSSGKSVALAALAYRIFQERKYPVLFVNNPDVVFAGNTPAANALDNILKEMRSKGGRVLVILDWSLYNLERNDVVRNLSDRCHNRGHNVLFVASAYDEDPTNRYQIVKAPIRLTEGEKKAFKELLIDKGKLPRNTVENWMRTKSDMDGLLSMLYRLVYELHPQLERGLKIEVTRALEDTRQGILELDDPVPVQRQQLSSLAEQLIKAGRASARVPMDPELSKQGILDSLQSFSESLAVASLYKLRMPMAIAMHLLKIPNCENRQQYRDMVLNAPWLYYAMDTDELAPGAYYVSFRDPVDAAIYLKSIGKNEEEQMQIVADVIRTMKEAQDGFYYSKVQFLERLIKILGPNSDNPQVKENWIHTYGRGCHHVIEALAELREADIIEPQLVVQEIALIREYFGRNPQMDLQERVDWLEDAISIARQVLRMAERPNVDTAEWQQNNLDSITVESVNSELQLERCFQQAEEAGIELETSGTRILQSYDQRRERLLQIIQNQPDNSYAYTALLACFNAQYATDQGSPEMFDRMAEIMGIVDMTAANVPKVESNKHYQERLTEFFQVFDRVCRGIRAETYFQKLLAMGSPVGVYLKATRIKLRADIQYNAALTRENRAACRSVLDLLEDEQYAPVIRSHAPSQYMRLQLTWLYCNGRPLFERERQTTAMTEKEWISLYNLCDEFKSNIIERQPECTYRAKVYYIMALACAQLGQYNRAAELWRAIREDEFHTVGRQYTWHILSLPNGEPMEFTGTFNIRPAPPERHIYIGEMGRLVVYPSLQSINKAEASGEAAHLCIGTSYRGFNTFARNWRALGE